MQVILSFLLQMVILFALIAGVILLVHRYIVVPLMKNRQPLVREQNSGSESQKVLIPLRLQACERFVLYLERINPNNLLLRVSHSGLGLHEYQALLVRTIREEFEYNLSQQLYISQGTWELIRNAKEESISLVNRAAEGLPQGSAAADLPRAILDLAMERGKLPSAIAIDAVKREL
jgi:hypothetical protein